MSEQDIKSSELSSILPSQLAKYLDLFEKMLDATFLIDHSNFEVMDANPASEKILELELDGIRGKSILNWVHQEDHSDLEKFLRISRRRYHPKETNCRFRVNGEKEYFMRLSICSLKLSDQREVLQVIAKDTTEEFEAKQKAEKYVADLAEMNQKLELMSITDEMTKLYNFRYFRERLLQEHDRSVRLGICYSIIFCDLDNFKHYNDRNGHPAGDELLRELANLIRTGSRSVDLVARYGGEEFAIICPETRDEDAKVLAERLRLKIQEHPFAHAEAQPLGFVSMSMGIACFPDAGKSADQVLKAADEAVYHSKKSGRNQVTLSKKLQIGGLDNS